MEARLMVEVKPSKSNGEGRVAMDLGETILMACVFDDGTASLYSGRQIKAIRRYWQKVRANLKQKSRRWFDISHKERKQVDHLLHIATSHLISECRKRGTKEIAIGDLNGVRENIDYRKSRLKAHGFNRGMKGGVARHLLLGMVRATNLLYNRTYERCSSHW
jgi:putative transposase